MFSRMFLFGYSWPNNLAGLCCFTTTCNRGTRETMLSCRTSPFCSTASSEWRKPNKRANVSLFNSVSEERAAPPWMPLFSERYWAPLQNHFYSTPDLCLWLLQGNLRYIVLPNYLLGDQIEETMVPIPFFFFTVHPKEINKHFFQRSTMLIVNALHQDVKLYVLCDLKKTKKQNTAWPWKKSKNNPFGFDSETPFILVMLLNLMLQCHS